MTARVSDTARPAPAKARRGRIFVGIGGWTFAPWRGAFYPEGLPHAHELGFASRVMTSIEINGTFYSSFKPAVWERWRDETPDGFVFAIKASRYCTYRKSLAEAGEAIERFLGQGLALLGPRLGPITWQMMETKAFDAGEIAAFLSLLPRGVDDRPLRHAIEARHPSFAVPAFRDLAHRHDVAIVVADHEDYPAMDEPTTDFSYARLMRTVETEENGYDADALDGWAARAEAWAQRGDAFVYVIDGAKMRAPAAALALIDRVGRPPAAPPPAKRKTSRARQR